jgi:hypothetical protein
MPTRLRRKFIRHSSGAATRRRIISFSSHSLCFFSWASLPFLVGRDRGKRFLQNLEDGPVAGPVGRLFHLDDISQFGQMDRRSVHLHGMRP